MHRLALPLLFLLPTLAQAEGRCASEPPPLPPLPPGHTHIEADRAQAEAWRRFTVEGDVRLRRDRLRIEAPRLHWLRHRDRIEAPHGLRYDDLRLHLQGEQALWRPQARRGHIEGARYRLHGDPALRGRAARAQWDGQRLEIVDGDYSTCPGPRPAWRLSARRLHLEPTRNRGRARDVRLHLGPLPVLWLPYLEFPLHGRKTGLLPPSLDRSTARGDEARLPLYLNLAPHYDATLTARPMSRRGLAWEGEFRYLGRTRQGRLEGAYLARDRQTGRPRHHLRWRHRQDLGPWRLALRWQQVSDGDYLRDLGAGFADANRPYLERRLDLQGRHGRWRSALLLQDYQRLDPSLPTPYRRLPRLRLTGHGETWRLDLEHSRFQQGERPIARRNRLDPALTPRLTRPYGELGATLALPVRHYAGGATLIVPRLALDTRLYLDRRRDAIDETLVPRLYWTYTPYRRQETLPRLDTAPLPRGQARLFTPARYAGGDRIGDRHSLTLALDYQRRTPRLRQSWRLALLTQLEDQRLRLPGEPVVRAGEGEPLLRWDGQGHGPWRAFAELLWPRAPLARLRSDPDEARFGLNYARAQLRGRLDYQYAQGGGAQLSLRLWQRRGRWQYGLAGRYDLSRGRDLETRVGVGYGTCCWSLALHGRRYRGGGETAPPPPPPPPVPYQRLTLTVELVGLGRSGRDLRQRLGL